MPQVAGEFCQRSDARDETIRPVACTACGTELSPTAKFLDGQPGAYVLRAAIDEVDVPPNLQSTISARIDRLPAAAKKTLNAASVIGLRFDADLLTKLVGDADVAPLISAEVVDQVSFTPPIEYVFRHPLTRTVAYESQLKSDRAQLHRTLAAAIEARGASDENAALMAQHLEAAGDLHAAFDCHMRAAKWFTFRNFAAAQSSWLRARDVADRLLDNDTDRLPMRIAPRALLCANEYRIRSGHSDTAFAELKELCTIAGDKRSLAIGLAGIALASQLAGMRDISGLATELVTLLESVDDSMLTVALSVAYLNIKLDAGQFTETLELAQRVIELTDDQSGEVGLMSISPLTNAMAIRGAARWAMGIPGWRDDFAKAYATASTIPPALRSGTFWIVYLFAIPNGVLLSDERAYAEVARIASAAASFGEQIAIDMACTAKGITLVHRGGFRARCRSAAARRIARRRSAEPLHDSRQLASCGYPRGARALPPRRLRLRALLAKADGDEATYRDQRDRYRKMANDLGFDGHIKWSAEMV